MFKGPRMLALAGALLLAGAACGSGDGGDTESQADGACVAVEAAGDRLVTQGPLKDKPTGVPARTPEEIHAWRTLMTLIDQNPECFDPGIVAQATAWLSASD